MKKMWLLALVLLAAAATASALSFTPVATPAAAPAAADQPTQLIDWCAECAASGDCWSCCRCGGGTPNACVRACGL